MGLRHIAKFFWKKLLLDIIVVSLVIFMPNLPPNADITQSIKLSKTKPLEGPLALNDKLKDTEIWHAGEIFGPEAFAEYNGEVYASVLHGHIVKFVGNEIVHVARTGRPCKGHYEEHICGRPLGLKFDKNGNLIVADAYYGILKIDVKTGEKEVLVSPNLSINGKKPKLFNSVALASNGDIYWSDSSTQFQLRDLVYDALADPSGRLLHYDAKTKTNKVLIDKLHFANGVILADDEEFVLVAETMHNKVHRYYLKGPKKGKSDVFLDGLPGVPDNLQKDGHGGFLVPLVESLDDEHPLIYQVVYPFPLVKKFVCRLMGLTESVFEAMNRHYPNEFSQKAMYYIGHYSSTPKFLLNSRSTLLHVSRNGNIIESVHSITNKKLGGFSEAFIFKDQLYLGSPLNEYIGRIPLSSLGWEKLKRDVPAAEPKVQTKELPKVETKTPPPVKQQPTTTTTPKPETTTTPKPQTTQAPRTQPPTTPPPTQAPKTQPTTPPPTQAPKPQTTQPPKAQPTQARKAQPTQAPKAQPTPKQESKPQPKQESAPPKQQTTPPPVKITTAPPSQQTVPPSKAAPKQQTPPPKQQAPPSKQAGGKAVPAKEL